MRQAERLQHKTETARVGAEKELATLREEVEKLQSKLNLAGALPGTTPLPESTTVAVAEQVVGGSERAFEQVYARLVLLSSQCIEPESDAAQELTSRLHDVFRVLRTRKGLDLSLQFSDRETQTDADDQHVLKRRDKLPRGVSKVDVSDKLLSPSPLRPSSPPRTLRAVTGAVAAGHLFADRAQDDSAPSQGQSPPPLPRSNGVSLRDASARVSGGHLAPPPAQQEQSSSQAPTPVQLPQGSTPSRGVSLRAASAAASWRMPVQEAATSDGTPQPVSGPKILRRPTTGPCLRDAVAAVSCGNAPVITLDPARGVPIVSTPQKSEKKGVFFDFLRGLTPRKREDPPRGQAQTPPDAVKRAEPPTNGVAEGSHEPVVRRRPAHGPDADASDQVYWLMLRLKGELEETESLIQSTPPSSRPSSRLPQPQPQAHPMSQEPMSVSDLSARLSRDIGSILTTAATPAQPRADVMAR